MTPSRTVDKNNSQGKTTYYETDSDCSTIVYVAGTWTVTAAMKKHISTMQ